MISIRDLAAALHGLRLLLRFDARGLESFDRTPAGFWRSFTVAFVLAPFHLLHLGLDFGSRTTTLSFGPYMVVNTLSYVISWVGFPFAMLYLTRLLDREARYFWHMVPYNWFQLPVGLVFFPLALLADVNLIPAGAANVLNLAAFVVFVTYIGFIAVHGLKVSAITAAGLVVLDLLINIFTNQIVARI